MNAVGFGDLRRSFSLASIHRKMMGPLIVFLDWYSAQAEKASRTVGFSQDQIIKSTLSH